MTLCCRGPPLRLQVPSPLHGHSAGRPGAETHRRAPAFRGRAGGFASPRGTTASSASCFVFHGAVFARYRKMNGLVGPGGLSVSPSRLPTPGE